MDAQNIAWHVENKASGYPAGGFFTRVLTMIFNPPAAPQKRLQELVEIFNMADNRNTAQLESILPGVRPILIQVYAGKLNSTDAVSQLTRVLRILPQTLARMDSIAESLAEYAMPRITVAEELDRR